MRWSEPKAAPESGRDHGLPVLTDPQRDTLLTRLGLSVHLAPSTDTAGLATLVRAWLLAMPFHNLDLLAASLGTRRSLDQDEALARCLSGLGGPCHVQSLGFAALLSACGFEVALCAATIGHPDDHLLVRVTLGREIWLCDVGNGQPYLTPFPLNTVQDIHHLGWHIRTEPCPGGLRLWRSSPDLPGGKLVYVASPAPRRWSDFANVITQHHAHPGFGPFMTGLRAVRLGTHRMDTLRDDRWTSFGPDGHTVRTVPMTELPRLLVDVFRLDGLPIETALIAWQHAQRT